MKTVGEYFNCLKGKAGRERINYSIGTGVKTVFWSFCGHRIRWVSKDFSL
jgi:hypothetical protein